MKCHEAFDNLIERFKNENMCGTKEMFNNDLPLYLRSYIEETMVSKLMNVPDFQINFEVRKEACLLFDKMLQYW